MTWPAWTAAKPAVPIYTSKIHEDALYLIRFTKSKRYWTGVSAKTTLSPVNAQKIRGGATMSEVLRHLSLYFPDTTKDYYNVVFIGWIYPIGDDDERV